MEFAYDQLSFTVAVFAHGSLSTLELALVHLEADTAESATADTTARGYRYIGYIAFEKGVPRVNIEPGYAAAMAFAGPYVAELFGPILKAYQLEQKAALAAERQ